MSTPNLTLRQLRAFHMVAREQSMTRAADKLHLTPSALSMLTRSLEEELGMQLFERTTRRVLPTEAGLQLLPMVEAVLGQLDEGVRELQASQQRQTEHLTIATSPLLAASLMPQIIARFRAELPNVQVALLDLQVDQVAAAVRSGDADLGVCTAQADLADLKPEVLHEDTLMLACPDNHPLALQEAVHWSELGDYPLVLIKTGSGLRTLVDQTFGRLTSRLAPAFEVANVSTALGLVSAGLGVSILPAYSLARSKAQGITGRPLVEPVVTRKIVAISLPTRPLSSSSKAFLTRFRRYAPEVSRGVGSGSKG